MNIWNVLNQQQKAKNLSVMPVEQAQSIAATTAQRSPASINPSLETPSYAGGFSPSIIDESAYDALTKRIQNKSLSSIKEQKDALKKLEERINANNFNYKPELDVSPLIALASKWSGTDFTGAYEKPKDYQAQQMEALRLESDLQNKRNQISQNELELLKSQLGTEVDKLKINAAAAKASEPKQITVSEAANLGAIKKQLGTVKSLRDDYSNMVGKGSSITQFIPGTEAAAFTDKQRLAAQEIGTALEGGKLTDFDFQKYMSLMPQQGDSQKRAKEKLDALEKIVKDKYNSSLDAFGQAGYNVSGFSKINGKPSFEEWKKSKGL